ncbi:MAG: twin-arginine translocase subunit TatC, partial [Chloroflexota bacterium]
VAGWFLAPHVIDLIDQPLCGHLKGFHCQLVIDSIYGGFTLQLKVAIIIGFIFALPVSVFELWAFVGPAFGPAANRWAPVWIVSALGLFSAGGATGYFVFPLAISFFTRFHLAGTQYLLTANGYVGFISLILVVFGLSFELPLVLVSLSAVGITSSRWLARKRLYAFFAILIFANIVTPGADWFSPLILAGIMYFLFEISIIVSRALGK